MIVLPWPPSILSPNARTHWAARSKAAKKYRGDCCILTKAARPVIDWEGIVHLWIEFCPPDRRARDDDNLIAAFKSGRDGVADALVLNDKRFRIHPFISDEVVKGGAVKIKFSRSVEPSFAK